MKKSNLLFKFLPGVHVGIPLPVEWSVQPKDSSGKEKDVYLVQLDPINHANEYNKVADEIKKTTSVTITKIERVQNPGLYRAYMVKKDQMDQKSGGNEKFLFHGTAQGSCSSISKFGFNRSYCGKNGKFWRSYSELGFKVTRSKYVSLKTLITSPFLTRFP